MFESLQEVRDMTADWLHRYNHHRPMNLSAESFLSSTVSNCFPNLYF